MISLKAGGAGLNLTAASYVFIFDPWWNPAVEAQAIDRTHRIGQAVPVNAYRFIARGTVEEKIRALQRDKAALAKLVEVIGPRFAKRPGGYTRILKRERRRLGDGGEQAIIEFVERTPRETPPPATEKAEAAKAEAKPKKASKKAAATS